MREALEELKARLDARRPLGEEQIKAIDDVLLPRRIFATNAFENHSLTLEETRYYLETQRMVVGRLEREFRQVRGVQAAMRHLGDLTAQSRDLSESVIKELHDVMTAPIGQSERYFPGQYKDRDLPILSADGTRLDFVSHQRVAEEMGKLLSWFGSQRDAMHPVDLAARFHCWFSHIHPFMEANGRMARLLDDIILEGAGYGPTLFEDRERYYAALRTAERSIQGANSDLCPEAIDVRPIVSLLESSSAATLQIIMEGLEGRIKPSSGDLDTRLQIFDKVLSGHLDTQEERRIQEEKETTKLAISREIEETLKQRVHSRIVPFILAGPIKFQQNNQQLSPLIAEATQKHGLSFEPSEILYEYHFAPDLKEVEARGMPLKPFMRLLSFSILSHGPSVGVYSGILPFDFGKVYIKQENRSEIVMRLDPTSLREIQGEAAYHNWNLSELKKFIFGSLDEYFGKIELEYTQTQGDDKNT
jgi:hypothetical protein